jgi:hypothetical protein
MQLWIRESSFFFLTFFPFPFADPSLYCGSIPADY